MKWNTSLYDGSHDFVSRFGQDLIEYLQPQKGEKILDLGCGTGDLAFTIAQKGAEVTGIDSSETMIDSARSKYPGINFQRMDARNFRLETLFDAIFSNAVLHWVPEKEKVIARMYEHLKPGGRIIVEFGGKGNNEQMLKTLRKVFPERGYKENADISFWYFPSIGEYATELERQGLRVVHAEHFDRPTMLKGENGVVDWFRMFGAYFFENIPEVVVESILKEVQKNLLPSHFKDGCWYADYKRLRMVALKE